MGVDIKKGFKAVLLVCRTLLPGGLGGLILAGPGPAPLVFGPPLLALARLAGRLAGRLATRPGLGSLGVRPGFLGTIGARAAFAAGPLARILAGLPRPAILTGRFVSDFRIHESLEFRRNVTRRLLTGGHAGLVRQHHGRPVRQGKIKLLAILRQHADRIPEHVGPQGLHGPLGGHVAAAQLGGAPLKIRIVLLLVGQTTKQPSAHSGNLGGIEKEVLILGHLDGHRLEAAQKTPATAHLTAVAKSADHLCLMAHPDLAKFDARAVVAHQVLDQFAKIHPARGREIKNHLTLVEVDLHIDELHVQAQTGHGTLAILASVLGHLTIFLIYGDVLGRGRAIDGLDGLGVDAFRQCIAQGHDLPETYAFLGLDQHLVVHGEHEGCGHEKVYLSLASERNTNVLSHIYSKG